MPHTTACLRFQDPSAPYKGVWTLEDHGRLGVKAFHATFHRQPATGCLIEQRSFAAPAQARQFVHHLQMHGWSVLEKGATGGSLLNGVLSS
ncbi:MAG: hypothetical protein FJ078_02850 [Cyanobacteria bacterium K_DeepCast_35m_m2_155]|nr:hypothetical protein [Cyanobacteria bacterium K_DeepCast_35m_m2_155]